MNNQAPNTKMTNIKKAIDRVYSLVSPLFTHPKKHFKTWLVIVGVLVASWAVVFFLRSPEPTQASWWNETWLYRRAIQISNDNGEDLEDFQVAITLDTASLIADGKMQDTCDDVRFTNINGKLLPYFQTTACNAATTRYWVKVDNIPTPSATIYVYYGNQGAPSGSNRSNTFDLSFLGTFSQTFSDANIATNHGASSDRVNNFYISQSTYVNRFNTSWAYQQQYGSLDIYTGLCYDDKEDRFYGIDWSNKQWSTFTTDFVETSPMDQALGDQPIDCATDSTYVYTNHRNGKICRNKIVDNTKECIDMDALSGFDWGGQGLTYSFGYLFAGTTSSYGANGNRIYVINIDDWNDPEIVTYWDASGYTLTEVAGLTWKDKYIYQTSRSQDNANEWQGPVKVATTEPSVGTPGSEEISPGPVAYWKFDEGTGTTANDSSGQGNYGNIVNGPSWQNEENCVFDKCMAFNASEYVDLGNPKSLQITESQTISMWLKPANFSARRNPYAKAYGGEGTITQETSGTLNYYYGTAGTNSSPYQGFNSGQSLTLNEWNYITIVRDLENMKLRWYINGKETSETNASYAAATASSLTAYIGNGYTNRYAGLIDEVKIYPYARTEEQIKSDYIAGAGSKGGAAVFGHKTETAQITPISSKLVAHWKFDEGYGTTANNSGFGGSALVGTLGAGTSAPTWTNEGKVGKALSFDGSNDYVNLGSPDLLDNIPHSDFSISAWIYDQRSGGSEWGTIFGAYSSGVGWDFRTISNAAGARSLRISAVHSNDWLRYQSTDGTIPQNIWTHVVGVFDSTAKTAKLYINGREPSYQTQDPGDGTYSSDASLNKEIGRLLNHGQRFLGLIDEVKIYNTALTQEEILQDYNQGAAAVMGAMGTDDSGNPTQAASAEYCIPGDASTCSAPVARWDFEEGSGTTADDTSDNNNHGTLVNGPTWVTGKVGKALEFDGENEYIITESLASSPNTETLSLWLYAKDTGVIVSELGQQAINSGYHYIKIGLNTNNELKANIWNCNNDLTFGTINLNQWYFATLVYDGTAEKAYLNGEFKDSYTCSRSAPSTQYLAFAATDSQSGGGFDDTDYFQGKIDDIRLYDYARTPAQIAWDYNRGAPVGHWKFDECQGTTAHDASGNENHGTINIGSSAPQTTVGTCSAPTDGTGAWYNGKEGRINGAMSFDGEDDYMEISQPSVQTSPNLFTVSAWVNPSNHDSRFITPNSVGIDQYIGYEGSNQRIYINVAESADTNERRRYSASGSVPISSWTHWAISLDNKDLEIYINGKLDSEYNEEIDIAGWTGNWRIGQRGNNSFWYEGKIDDLRIFNYALTDEQVKLLYNNGAVSFR